MKVSRVLLLIGLFLSVFSCKDETFDYDRTLVEEGLPATVEFKFASQGNTVVTRAERDPTDENRVNNLYVFIFDSQGNVHDRRFCTPDKGLSYTEGYQKGKAVITTKSLNHAKIVGIANVTVEGITSTAYTVTENELDAVQSYSELENKVMRMTENSIERYAIFMLTGMAEDGQGSTDITIPGSDGGTTETLGCELKLRRTDAKVKFVVKTVNPDPDNYKDFSFSPRNWVVKRVPAQSYILPKDEGDYDGADAVYFTSPERPFEVIDRDKDNPKLYTGGSFVYYMPENRKSPLKSIEQGENDGYALREDWEGTYENEDKKFVYANANSSYVEITGLLSYYNAQGKNTNADVRFIVHLGNPKEKGGNVYGVNNYNTNRNTFYTYNITIRGVDDIKVEVEDEEEIRPGYEGDVVDTENTAFVFDSHYDRCLIEINPNTLPEAGEGEIYWSVNTPFSRGVHTVTDANTEVEEEMRDYRWIKFAVNEEYGVYGDREYVKYPGDQNYDDPYPFAGMIEGKDYNAPSPYYSDLERPDARLLDINQLMIYLRQKKAEGRNTPMKITVFVDENLYFKHPITGEESDGHSLWKLTSDKEDRIMYLVINKPLYSSDGNSSVVKAEYSFRQRTIRTIFNVNKPELTSAWGLESVMETAPLPAGDVSKGSDKRNGRTNCLSWLVGKEWTQIVKTAADGYELQDGYNNAAYACMLRNRDLNGDNRVDAREIRWYLAAIDQLTDIYLGEYALDEQSRLYPSNAVDRNNQTRWHYTSSSSYEGSESWILWAEEGASRGSSGGSIKDDGSNNTLFSYRCVRNLGLSLDNPNEIPTDLIQVIPEAGGYYLIDATNMNVKSRRNSSVTTLPSHNERSDINRPYAKFRVHKDCFGGDGKTPYVDKWNTFGDDEWNDYPWEHYQTYNPCPVGYRIPNQRELLIMTTRMPPEDWKTFHDEKTGLLGVVDKSDIKPDYVSQTSFSLNGIDDTPYSGGERQGFLWNSDNDYFYLQNSKEEEGYVRPVQDVR